MKVNVVTLYNKKYAPVFKESFESHIAYCEENEFNYYPFYSNEKDSDQIKLDKFKTIYKACNREADFVLYLDVDVIIKNPKHNLFSILEEEKEIYVNENNNGVDTAVMLLKNTSYTHGMLGSLINLGPHTPTDEKNYVDETNRSDRELFKFLYNSFSKVRDKVKIIDKSIISYSNSKDAFAIINSQQKLSS